MTQEDLSNLVGTTKSAISRYENNIRTPGFDMVDKLASALNVKFSDIVDQGNILDLFFGSESEDLDILHYFDMLDDYHQERAIACTRAIAGFPLIEGNKPETEELLITYLSKLNAAGQQKAVERVEELTEIPKYQREQDAE